MMTLDEAIKHCEEVAEKVENDCIECAKDHEQLAEWLKELKQFKEQQPCVDCISRQAVLDIDIRKLMLTTAKPIEMIEQKIKQLPPVTPQPKMGRWIDEGFYAEGHNEHAYRCSECDEQYIGYVGEFKHCPNCAADGSF